MKYDFIIVGGGSAGAVLAARVSEDPNVSVLLLEAGPDYTDFESLPNPIKYGNAIWPAAFGEDAHVWGYKANAVSEREEIVIPRGKVMGGSSAINGQVFYRGVPEDYDEWESFGNKGWSYTDVLPYFRKSENDLKYGMDDFHGNDGPIPVKRYEEKDLLPAPKAFIEACIAEGFQYNPDSNHPDSTGVGPRALNNVDGIRMSTALTYLNMARHRINLTIRSDVMVRRVLFEGNTAIGVEAESAGDLFSIEGKELLICGGAVNSPQLLMLSGVGPREQLEYFSIPVVKEINGVGQNLRDHPSAMVLYESYLDEPEVDAPSLQVGMRFQTPGSKVHNDMQMSPILMTSEHRPAHVELRDGVSYLGFSVALQKALTSGQISLRSSNPSDHPILEYAYLTDSEDLRRMREAVRLCVKITEREEFKEILKSRVQPTEDQLNSDELLDQWLLDNVSTQHHSSGTCKMGPISDPMAVVDSVGRVHGLNNIRVVDASIMPDVVRANTNATTIMIAEKIADAIINT